MGGIFAAGMVYYYQFISSERFCMADFYKKKPFGPYTSFVYLLLVIAALEFIGLAGVLASDSQAREPARTEPVQEPLASREEAMPEWLEPAEKAAEE